MRTFVDLNLRVPISNLSKVEETVRTSSELGYRIITLLLPPHIARAQLDQLRNICNSFHVDLATRVNFSPRTSQELLRDLRRFRRKFEIISVTCTSKRVARQAAKDRRVDLLNFSSTEVRQRFFDRAEAGLVSKASASLEIEMSPLLSLTRYSRIRLLSRLRREVEIAEKFNVPVILSSGAAHKHFLRGPYDYAALATLFDMSLPSALRSLSENPLTLIRRNREKLSPNYVAPGIKVVRRETGV